MLQLKSGLSLSCSRGHAGLPVMSPRGPSLLPSLPGRPPISAPTEPSPRIGLASFYNRDEHAEPQLERASRSPLPQTAGPGRGPRLSPRDHPPLLSSGKEPGANLPLSSARSFARQWRPGSARAEAALGGEGGGCVMCFSSPRVAAPARPPACPRWCCTERLSEDGAPGPQPSPPRPGAVPGDPAASEAGNKPGFHGSSPHRPTGRTQRAAECQEDGLWGLARRSGTRPNCPHGEPLRSWIWTGSWRDRGAGIRTRLSQTRVCPALHTGSPD